MLCSCVAKHATHTLNPKADAMKLAVKDPVEAARRYGGATWEPGTGWWTHVTGPPPDGTRAASVSGRDAIYVPTCEKSGQELTSALLF